MTKMPRTARMKKRTTMRKATIVKMKIELW